MDRETIRNSLLSKGIQPSAPRMAIASYVWSTCSHPTAEEVKSEVEKTFPTVSLATVYNTLNLLVEKGLLKEVQDPNIKSVRYDCKTEPHFHFIDEESGQMFDLDPELLPVELQSIKLSKEFEITGIDVTLRGRLSPDRKSLEKVRKTEERRRPKP